MEYGKPMARRFKEEGYVVIPQLLKGEQLAKLLAACNYVLEQYAEEFDRKHPGEDFVVMRHLNDTRWHQETHEHFVTIMEMIADPRCLGPVEQVFDGPSLLHSTSFFSNHRFKDLHGNWHRDFQFAAKDEEDDHRLWKQRASEPPSGIQFQIALIDNDDLEYVPYSAGRYDTPEEAYIRLADSGSHAYDDIPNTVKLALKAGDAVMINANGLHRGRYFHHIPRRTLLYTYTPLNKPSRDYFSNQPWCAAPGYLDGLSPRATVYLQQFVDTYHDFWSGKVEADIVYR